MDQSLLAAPHGFSQLATSFLAYPRLGIPRAPLLRLASFQRKAPKSPPSNNRLTSLRTHMRERVSVGACERGSFFAESHLLTFPTSHALILALDSAATPPDKQQDRLPDLSKPKLSKISFCARYYYFFHTEPLKITKPTSPSTPLQEQVCHYRDRQNADQEVPERTLHLLIF
jgi:hypothetical protein